MQSDDYDGDGGDGHNLNSSYERELSFEARAMNARSIGQNQVECDFGPQPRDYFVSSEPLSGATPPRPVPGNLNESGQNEEDWNNQVYVPCHTYVPNRRSFSRST